MAGKIYMRGYTDLAKRLGVPRTNAVRLVQTGRLTLLEEKPGLLVAKEDDVKELALQQAIRAEQDYHRNLDRALIARVMNDPEKASDREMVYCLARVDGKDWEELYYYFKRRSETKPGFLEKKFEEEQARVNSEKAKFPQKANYWNSKLGRTETILRAPQPITIPPEE